VKLAYISTTQYGWTKMTVPMKILLQNLERKGLSFIHAMTLCKLQDALRKMAATDNHHP
jgi:hypothetical protein